MLTTREDLTNLVETAKVIQLLPVEQWSDNALLPDNSAYLSRLWFSVGFCLKAEWTGQPNPFSTLENSAFRKTVQMFVARYLALKNVLFEVEPFIKEACRMLNRPEPPNRETLLCLLAMEEASILWWLYGQEYFEGTSESDLLKFIRCVEKYGIGRIGTEQELISIHENSKASLNPTMQPEMPTEFMPWTRICFAAILANKKHLPSFTQWVQVSFRGQFELTKGFGKFVVVNKEVKRYPGRGKGKRQKAS